VRIATTEALAARLVQGGLLDLRAQYPGLELEVLGGNRLVDLSRGEAELAIRLTPTSDPNLIVRVLGRYTISLFAAPVYLRARGVPRAPNQLDDHDVLLPSGELEQLPEARWLASRPRVRVAFRSTSMPALIEAAVRGHGIVPITRAWGETTPGLDHLFELSSIPARPAWLVMHPDVATQPGVRLVADRLAAEFALTSK
jgi:DNA-binding transcriptional LysR family regulator